MSEPKHNLEPNPEVVQQAIEDYEAGRVVSTEEYLQELTERMRHEAPDTWAAMRKQAIFDLRVFLKSMNRAERLEMIDDLLEGYCPVCARWLYGGEECYCWNDE